MESTTEHVRIGSFVHLHRDLQKSDSVSVNSEHVYMHIRQCHWCTGKAYSPSHRFSSPETTPWPSDSGSLPATSRAARAGKDKRGDKCGEGKKGNRIRKEKRSG